MFSTKAQTVFSLFAISLCAMLANSRPAVPASDSNTINNRRLIDLSERVGLPMVGTKDAEYGSAVEISSAGGDVLAVGAPHHGYSSANADPTQVNIEGGAVFLYRFDGTEWRLSFFFAGFQGEQIGSHLSLSANGSRIAIRRNKSLNATLTNQVEVYNVDGTTGVPTKLGSDLSCGGNGDAVSLSSDGNRIAISCDTINGGRGLVEVFEWNAAISDWSSMGRVINTNDPNPGARFGRCVSFDNSGSRLAVSAHNYDFNGTLNRGLVRVYDYVGGARWVQIGADVVGSTADDQFGFSMALSGDGLSFIASAPPSSLFGEVQVYTLVIGNVWLKVGDSIIGTEEGDRFGRAVATTDDGSRIAASSFLNRDQRGVVKVFDLVDNQWTLTGMIEGENSLDRLGHGLLSVALSADGARVVAGSTGQKNTEGLSVGGVSVYQVALVTTTNAPLMQSTDAFETDTFSPTSALSKFDWDLERVGNATAVFSDRSENQEILLSYNISNRRTKIGVFEDDCVTAVSEAVVRAKSQATIKTSTHSDLQVALDMRASVTQSNFWIAGDLPGTGSISFCVRVDLVKDDANATSVHFFERKLFVVIDLRQGFSIEGIEEDRIAPDDEDIDADVDYGMTACQCNESLVCSNEIMVQGKDVLVCLFTVNANISIAGIESFSLIQGSETVVVNGIIDSVEDDLTSVTVFPNITVIRAQMISAFFVVEDPEDVSAQGVAILSFVNSSSIRRLQVHSSKRTLQEDEGGFDVSVTLASGRSSRASEQTFTALLYLLLAFNAFLFV